MDIRRWMPSQHAWLLRRTRTASLTNVEVLPDRLHTRGISRPLKACRQPTILTDFGSRGIDQIGSTMALPTMLRGTETAPGD
jgi:hypothetical protein